MPKASDPVVKYVDVNAHILSHLDELNRVHLLKKPLCFAKGVPFYTCIDEANKIYTKETVNGKTILVTRHFDFVKDLIVEKEIDPA
jgi:hypothetical protein